ncbi:uncharacterized protein LOC106457643 [Limulus polyphemus]|uniref:Uncharacterized protein LOC106457643 n=1 Tax=Limulus polyphemus TaxID=6850 RepID=A0ABM1B0W9_LIMPO|nr:uncharacterized protein LOC106457643 [Limulus polyphemus]
MEMNTKKTKSIVVTKNQEVPKINLTMERKSIKRIKNFIQLGHMSTEDAKSEVEIQRRIEIARSAFNNMSKVLTSSNFIITTRMKLVKCYVWSILLYGAETWTISKAIPKKIEAFEMWIYVRVLKISRTEHKTNEQVLEMMKTKITLSSVIKKIECEYFGHINKKWNTKTVARRKDEWEKEEEADQEICGWITSKIVWEHHIVTVLEWRKEESMTINLLRADGT